MRTKFGHMQCRDCGKFVVVRANENETLSYSCDECGDAGYCKKGQDNYSTWLGRITRVAAPAPEKKSAVELPAKKTAGTIIG